MGPADRTESPNRLPLDRFLPPALLTLLPCLAVGWALRGGGMLFGMDMLQGSYYIRALVGREMAGGGVAAWDPNAMCGFPLMAALQSAVFYPLTWPVVVLGPGPFWSFTVLSHLILAGLFVYGWLRYGLSAGPWAALIGALITQWSGYLLTHAFAGHISQISSFPWIAALLWRAERMLVRPTLRRGSLLALTTAMLILPGFPECAFFGALLLGVRLLLHVFREREQRRARLKDAAILGGAAAMGLLLAAPQLLPTLELIPRTQRVSINTFDFATTYSLPPENLITFLAPGFFGDGVRTPYWGREMIWESCGFVGLCAFALAALSLGGRHPQRLLWAGVASAGLLLALGAWTPVFRIFFAVVPGADLFRAPGRYLGLLTLAISALAAFGFDRWWSEDPGLRRATLRLGLGTAAILALVIIAYATLSFDRWKGIVESVGSAPNNYAMADLRARFPDLTETTYKEARKSLGGAIGVLAVLTGALLGTDRLFKVRGGAVFVVMMLVADLFVFGNRYLKSWPTDRLAWPPEFVERVRTQPGGPFRIATLGINAAHIGKSQLAGVHHLGGYESMLLRNYSELMNSLSGEPPNRMIVIATIPRHDPVLDMLGVRFWLAPEGSTPPPPLRPVGRVDDQQLLESDTAFPRAFLVPKAVVLPYPDDRLHYLRDPGSDLRKYVVLDAPEPASAVAREGDLGAATVTSFGPGRYDIAAETVSGGWLVLTESFYPGWQARVDGTATRIFGANHFVQAIWLPPGKHRVEFEYRSTWLRLGAILCAAAAILPLVILGVRRLRARGPRTVTAPAA